jgi:serine/threonine-protein kinase RsbW
MTNEICDTRDLPAEIGQIAPAMAWLEAIADRDAWPPRLSFGMGLSLDEALTNIVSYAFVGHPVADPNIRLSVTRSGTHVSLKIVDNGLAFDPTQIPPIESPTSLDDAGIGGHGMQLMRHYMDKIEYSRVADTNQLTLRAALPSASAQVV